MPKHVFYDLSYVIIMSSMIKKMINLMYLTTDQLNDSWH